MAPRRTACASTAAVVEIRLFVDWSRRRRRRARRPHRRRRCPRAIWRPERLGGVSSERLRRPIPSHKLPERAVQARAARCSDVTRTAPGQAHLEHPERARARARSHAGARRRDRRRRPPAPTSAWVPPPRAIRARAAQTRRVATRRAPSAARRAAAIRWPPAAAAADAPTTAFKLGPTWRRLRPRATRGASTYVARSGFFLRRRGSTSTSGGGVARVRDARAGERERRVSRRNRRPSARRAAGRRGRGMSPWSPPGRGTSATATTMAGRLDLTLSPQCQAAAAEAKSVVASLPEARPRAAEGRVRAPTSRSSDSSPHESGKRAARRRRR